MNCTNSLTSISDHLQPRIQQDIKCQTYYLLKGIWAQQNTILSGHIKAKLFTES